MNSQKSQIIGMISLGLGSLVIGLIPRWFSSHRRRWPVLLSSLLCFGGGVLFSTSIIHILPELREATDNAEVLFCTGFFALYLIDEIVHFIWAISINSKNLQNQELSRSRSSSKNIRYGSVESISSTKSENNCQEVNNPTQFRNSHESLCLEQQQSSQICHVNHTEPCHDPPIGQIGLLFALSVHSILEGLAVGLEKSSSKVWLLIGAVASHKLVVAFCLGIELTSGISTSIYQHFVAIVVFSLGSVLGIGIGMSLTNLSNDWSSSIQPILQGLAGGSLLYVTVCEVLPRERARWHNQSTFPSASLIQFISVAGGFVITTVTTKYIEFNHLYP